MYQVAWENISGMPMRDYKILETWADVKDWVEIAQPSTATGLSP